MTEYCSGCQKKHDDSNWLSRLVDNEMRYVCSQHFKPWSPEFVPQSLVNERKQHIKSMLQPWREGEPSAEFMEAYPERAKKMFTTKERIKAKPVWKDTPNYSNWRKTK